MVFIFSDSRPLYNAAPEPPHEPCVDPDPWSLMPYTFSISLMTPADSAASNDPIHLASLWWHLLALRTLLTSHPPMHAGISLPLMTTSLSDLFPADHLTDDHSPVWWPMLKILLLMVPVPLMIPDDLYRWMTSSNSTYFNGSCVLGCPMQTILIWLPSQPYLLWSPVFLWWSPMTFTIW